MIYLALLINFSIVQQGKLFTSNYIKSTLEVMRVLSLSLNRLSRVLPQWLCAARSLKKDVRVISIKHYGIVYWTFGAWFIFHHFGNLVVSQHFQPLFQCQIQSERKMERCQAVQKFRQFWNWFHECKWVRIHTFEFSRQKS